MDTGQAAGIWSMNYAMGNSSVISETGTMLFKTRPTFSNLSQQDQFASQWHEMKISDQVKTQHSQQQRQRRGGSYSFQRKPRNGDADGWSFLHNVYELDS